MSAGGAAPTVAVVVPTFEQAAFLPRALAGALAQTHRDWELVVVDDGSDDDGATRDAVAAGCADPRVRAVHLPANTGMGAALQAGVDATTAPLVAYLPSDDVWLPDHLASLVAALDAAPGAALALADLVDPPPDAPPYPQLAQVLHRRTPERWTARAELETDDLDRLLWARLPGPPVRTGRATAVWTQHPGQRSRAVRESRDGGLNVFRSRYRVREPLRFASSDAGGVDEVALYAGLRARELPRDRAGLRVLLVGDLGFNPERVVALAERGHELHGLWTPDGLGDSGVGPVPFGHVREVRPSTRAGWRDAVTALRPDVVHALLSWRAVPFAHEVLTGLRDLAGRGAGRVPVVFHLKESPQACLRSGTWPQLVDLLTGADGVALATEEERAWVDLALPGRLDPARTLVLDGDLPLAAWHGEHRSPRLSLTDGEVHAVVVGRPLGLDAAVLAALAADGVHTHFHGLVDAPGPAAGWRRWLEEAQRAAPGRVHVHPRVAQDRWTAVLSRYDAGWAHRVASTNGGDLRRATWDDLNAPARLGPLAAAGLPVIARRSPGCAVAVQRLVGPVAEGGDGTGVLHEDVGELAAALHDGAGMAQRRDAAWATRASRTFDAHADALVDLFRRVVDRPDGAVRGAGRG